MEKLEQKKLMIENRKDQINRENDISDRSMSEIMYKEFGMVTKEDQMVCGDEVDQIYKIRTSNCLFEQNMQAEFSVVFFSIFGLLLNMILYELRQQFQEEDREGKITFMVAE